MDTETIKECNEIVNMFETTLFALKWQAKDDTGWKYQPIISEYEYILNKLKIFCINKIGFLDEQ